MSGTAATVLFIGGAGRSGSTLLESMLGQVPGVVAAGELTHLWDRGMTQDQLCGCGRPFSACPFWRDVLRVASGADPLPSPAALLRLKRRALSVAAWPVRGGARRRYLSVLATLYRAIAEVGGASVVVDSSKYPPEAYLLRGLPAHGLGVRYAHLVREPNAVVFSWQRKRLRPEVHDRTVYMPRYPWWKTTGAWLVYNALFDVLGRGEPGAVLRIRYEDLMDRPGDVLDRVCRHAGLERPDLGFVRGREVVLAPNHTVSGNPSRFRTGSVALTPDTAWRDGAPRWQAGAVNLLTAWQRRAYGYTGPEAGS
ncbi:MAG: sulfotransferase [Gemmatimonadetes bacterium]|nr:sulfotransferase [Gemmatimonadota bacterium]